MCSHNISVDMVMQDEKQRVDKILDEKYDILPTGTILMYNGSNWQNDSTIPGWYMCDGQNGTPDLRERFIAGCSYSTGRTIPNAPGKFGGENSFTLKTDNLPAHAHSIPAHNHAATVGSGGAQNRVKTSDAGTHSHGMESDGKHSHTVYGNRWSTTGWHHCSTQNQSAHDNDRTTSEDGSHSHTIYDAGSHSHTVNISAHTHSVTVSTQPQTTSGTIGGNASVDLTKSVKGYAVIFIMKVR